MSGKLTTHVLDTARGKPARAMRLKLYRLEDHGESLLVETLTNGDGRTNGPLLIDEAMQVGRYRLLFNVGDYFENAGNPDARRFLNVVPILFTIDDANAAYHVPLLVSPWAYSTYRGS